MSKINAASIASSEALIFAVIRDMPITHQIAQRVATENMLLCGEDDQVKQLREAGPFEANGLTTHLVISPAGLIVGYVTDHHAGVVGFRVFLKNIGDMGIILFFEDGKLYIMESEYVPDELYVGTVFPDSIKDWISKIEIKLESLPASSADKLSEFYDNRVSIVRTGNPNPELEN